MTTGELTAFLYEKFSQENACSWDNTGLLCGDPEMPVSRLLVALDIDDGVIDEARAAGAQCILSHHPVIKPAISCVRPDIDDRVWRLVRSGIAGICMHTNLDVSDGGVGDCLAAAVGLKNPKRVFADPECPDRTFGRIGEVDACAPGQFCEKVRAALGAPCLRARVGDKLIARVAVLGGSGRDYISEAARLGADAYVTSDCRYHDFQLAERLGLTLIDAGHFPTENVVVEPLMRLVAARFPEVEVLLSNHGDLIRFI